MGHGHRAAAPYLFTKKRNHRTTGADDIAEADRTKCLVRLLVLRLEGKILNDELGQPFRRPHDAGGPDCLVGGNQDQQFNVGLIGGVGDRQRPQRIINNALERIFLDQRDMFVGSSVKNRVHPMLADDITDKGLIDDRT